MAQDSTIINISMDRYISQMVENYEMNEGNKQSTSMMVSPHPQFVSGDSDKLDEADASLCRSIIGTLLFAANCYIYHICFTVGLLNRFIQTPEKNHLTAAKIIFRDLNSYSCSITHDAASIFIYVGCSDSDWPGDISKRKSVGEYMFSY